MSRLRERGWVGDPIGSQLEQSDLWTEPIWTSSNGGKRRDTEKIILHKKFLGEKLAWKGYDFALLKLAPSSSNDSKRNPEGLVAPPCLASKMYKAEKYLDNIYFSGFGRRYIPHCLTDGTGPVKYGVCGRPAYCNWGSRTTRCGLDFLYQGRKHKECLKDVDTPSAADPVCVSLRKSSPALEGEERLVHVMDGKKKYVTTCYPKRAPKGSKGWCTVRAPGVFKDKEPTPTDGWGFCSNEDSQKHCNEKIPKKQNTTAYRLGIFNTEFCKVELGKNLKVEQPRATPEEYADIEGKAGLYCLGQNYSHHFEKDLYYQRGVNGHFYELSWSDHNVMETMYHHSNIPKHAVSGGLVCFGDSGGPLFQLVYEPSRKLVQPIVIGAFSFMLWATCQGADEPGYFGKVNFVEDWIKKYVGDTVCWADDI